MTTIQSFKQR